MALPSCCTKKVSELCTPRYLRECRFPSDEGVSDPGLTLSESCTRSPRSDTTGTQELNFPAPVRAEPQPQGLAAEAARALAEGTARLVLVDSDCAGGTYYLKDGERTIGVFKPADEEPLMPANPKGLTAQDEEAPLKQGFAPGKGAAREVLAYVLDAGFAGVPETIMWQAPSTLLGRGGPSTPVEGSLQIYVQASGQSWDSGPAAFRAADVRRIGLLDLRLLSCDRHGGNMLTVPAEDGTVGLVPIDHTYCMPCSNLDELDFEWEFWKQGQTPFSPEELAWVAALRPEDDAEKVREAGLGSDAADLVRAAGTAVKVGVSAGLNLRELATFFRRQKLCEESGLEQAISKCSRLQEGEKGAGLGIDWEKLEGHLGNVMTHSRA